jgi:general secretion pathway protein E
MGIEPYLIAATVRGLLAQRLVRMVCEDCAEPYEASAGELARFDGMLSAMPATFRRGRGCDGCAGSGYRGRTGIYELLVVSDELRARIVGGGSLDEIRMLGRAQGMVPLRIDGWNKVCAGLTTIEELLRVTSDEEVG